MGIESVKNQCFKDMRAIINLFLGYGERAKRLKALASKLQFKFQLKMKFESLDTDLQAFELFKKIKGKKKLKHILSKWDKTKDIKIHIFDFIYPNDFTELTTTIIVFKSPLIEMPDFQIRPKNMGERVSSFFTKSKIEFGGYPDFDKKYKLTGNDDEQMNLLMLRSGLINDLVDEHDWQIEAKEDYFILYEKLKVVETEDFKLFLSDAIKIYKNFQKIVLDDFDREFGIE